MTGMGNLLQGSYIDVHEAARSGHIDEVRCVRNMYGIYNRQYELQPAYAGAAEAAVVARREQRQRRLRCTAVYY